MDPDVIARVAERKIQEGIDEGKFDNLPGKGKPVHLEEDVTTPTHLRMANKVLRNAGILPDWMQVQQDIVTERAEVERMRARLSKENAQRRVRLADLPDTHPERARFAVWHTRQREAYLTRLKSVNTSILKFCMMAPSTAEPYRPYRTAMEMQAFDDVFPPLTGMEPGSSSDSGSPSVASPSPAQNPASEKETNSRPGGLRAMAREGYQSGKGGAIGGWINAARLRGTRSAPLTGPLESEDITRADAPTD